MSYLDHENFAAIVIYPIAHAPICHPPPADGSNAGLAGCAGLWRSHSHVWFENSV